MKNRSNYKEKPDQPLPNIFESLSNHIQKVPGKDTNIIVTEILRNSDDMKDIS